MKNKIFILIVIIFIGVLLMFVGISNATNSIVPTASNNIQIIKKARSSLVAVDSGYMRVFYDSINNNIGVEYYDDNFNIQSKRKIDLELDIWGGFYAGADAYYIVVGQNNTAEDSSAEVIRVIKYDKNWNRIGASKITSDEDDPYKEIRYPFDSGTVEMTEKNGNLYIVTGHEGYVDSLVGQGHQGFLMIRVNEDTLEGEIVDADLYHSFSQYIDCKDSNLYVLEQSEGNRCAKLSKYDESTLENEGISILEYGGERTSVWAIDCYASVDGMAIASNNVLTVGTSIDQSQYDTASSNTSHNIYLTITPMDNFSSEETTIKWLTNYEDGGDCFTGLQITKINDNRFMISWEEYKKTQRIIDYDPLSVNILHYIFVDGKGNALSEEYTAPATISDCQPIVKNSKVVYYASSENMVNFYTIDANTGAFDKVMYRVAGENAVWNLSDDGVLTISGTGDISVDINVRYRSPLSSVKMTNTYYTSDNAWLYIRNYVKKINIEEGITTVPNEEFKYFSKLNEVILPHSMTTIGKEAFAYCYYLRKIVMLDNIQSIGQDALWSGYYSYTDSSKIVYATVYAKEGSYAATWAEQNDALIKYIEDLKLTDVSSNITLSVIGEPATKLIVNKLTMENADYIDMKEKISNQLVLNAYEITTKNGLCIGNNEITFLVGEKFSGKEITLVQKMSNGNIQTIEKTVDSNGELTITTSELSSFAITINPEDVDFLLGDLNEDGKVNVKDWNRMYKYINETIEFSELELLIGDLNKDGRVNIKDWNRMYAHITEVNPLW